MRHMLAMTLLGVSLAFGASAAMAESNSAANEIGDSLQSPPYELQAPDQTQQVAPAGPTTPQQPWFYYRLENIGQ
ncbi:MAG TPA: hypothetical protein VFW01_11205 [bacterium]|nr:hypothetical protein [bacterium]